MKKTIDAVAIMREARDKLASEWEGKPREEEIEALRKKYAHLTTRRKRTHRTSS